MTSAKAARGLKREPAACPRGYHGPLGVGEPSASILSLRDNLGGRERLQEGRLHLEQRMQSEPPTGDWLRWEEGSHLRPTSGDTGSGHQQRLTEAEAGSAHPLPGENTEGFA